MRRLVTKTRRQPTRITYYDFDSSGHLVPTVLLADWKEQLGAKLSLVADGEPIPKATFVQWGSDAGVRETAVEQWLTEVTERGTLERVKRGTYRKPRRN